ncbi:putative leader peptide [Streptomyces sp.]|uniref:putative leader peptide n=1 Tax=Streptomyces sp. TaxID=1931 RepID=UPI0039C9CBCC
MCATREAAHPGNHGAAPVVGPTALRTLTPRGPRVRLHRRQHIDLQRVAGALCRR